MRLLARHVVLVLALVFAVAVAALLAAPHVRIGQMPSELRYAPADSTNIIYTPALDPIWKTLSAHGEVISELDDAGADTVSQITSMLESAGSLIGFLIDNSDGVSVKREDLERAGVAFDRPFMAAFRGPVSSGDFVALVPVADEAAFRTAVASSLAASVDVRAVQAGETQAFERLDTGGESDALVQRDEQVHSLGAGVLVDNGQGAFPRTSLYPRDRLCSDALRTGAIPVDTDGVIAVRSAGYGPQPALRVRGLDANGQPLRTRAEAGGLAEPSTPVDLPPIDPSSLSTTINVGGRALEIRLAGANACYAFLDSGRAIVFSRLETLEEILRRGGATQALAAQQAFARGLRLTAPRNGAPVLGWAYLREADPNAEALSPVVASVGGDETQLALRLWSAPNAFYSQRVRFLFGPSGLPARGAHPRIGNGGFASLDSGDLGQLLQFADTVTTGGLDRALWGDNESGPYARYRPVVRALIDTPNVSRISVSIVGVRERVPQLVFRATAPAADAEALVLDLQRSQLRARDRTILARAAQLYGGPLPESGWTSGANAQLLQSANLLAPETGAEDGWRRAFAVQPAEVFAGEDYRVCVSAETTACPATAAFLFPPFTDNDERLIAPDLASRAEIVDRLRRGRYRMVSTYQDGVLWLAPDLDVLRDALNATPISSSQTPWSVAERRLHVRVEPRWLNSQRRLDGASNDESSGADGAIRQFSMYESVELTFDVLSNDNGFVIDINARR